MPGSMPRWALSTAGSRRWRSPWGQRGWNAGDHGSGVPRGGVVEGLQAGAHLLIRAGWCVARRPLQVLPDGSYLARMSLAGQKAAHPGGVLVRVIEHRVDGGEVLRLRTDLLEVAVFPAEELAALYPQ